MSIILLSIKPEYADRIFSGEKKYEFRKHLAKDEITRIVVYSSFPKQLVIGEVDVLETLSMKPTPLWELTKKEAGISRDNYRKYFSGCKKAYAYKLGSAQLYDLPKSLSDYGVKNAPQSFIYIT